MNVLRRTKSLIVLAALMFGLAAETRQAYGQTYTDLHDFNVVAGDPTSFSVTGILPQGRDGLLYGISHFGGTSDIGTFYSISPTTGTPSILYSFDGSAGAYPFSGATLGSDGNFYGAAPIYGAGNAGVIYKTTPTGTVTVLHAFANSGDSGWPTYPPLQGNDGNFYGTASGNDQGTQFTSTFYKVTSAGVFTTLHTFTAAEGNLCSGVVLGSDGNFYGGCDYNGANGDGTLFKITPTGKVTVLHNFNQADGLYPTSIPPIQAKDGNFYGVTNSGGSGNHGVIYQLKSNGAYKVLYNFTGGADGAYPLGSLTQGSDGKLYGTTANGGDIVTCANGTQGCGVIFRITTAGVYSLLYTFDLTHGAYPQSDLNFHTNGLLYGNTYSGGATGFGVFYSLNVGFTANVSLVNSAGKVGGKIGILGQGFTRTTTTVKFGGTAATFAYTSPTFITATVPAAALSGSVTVTTPTATLTSQQTFRVAPTLLSFTPPSGAVGTQVVITGTGLTQTTKVSFGGVAATTFTVNSDSQITVTVPTGAVTGKIVIVTKGGTASSKTSFTVN